MLVSDYIVSFFIDKKITDVFGYPGGMVTYLMNSFDKYKKQIQAHVCYHEQGAAFSACGYAQIVGLPGVAYATSGPGATNLLTGVANAYFDSIPCIFITGQVNTYDLKGDMKVRQRGFQETDIVSMADSITKYAVQITDPLQIRVELEKAFYLAMSGRKGPVILDIPMNIQRAEIHPDKLEGFQLPRQAEINYMDIASDILTELQNAKKPLIIAGAGISMNGMQKVFYEFVTGTQIPVVTSMIARDVIPEESENNFGFIGAYGHRWANFATAKADLLLTLGTRLDCRQTGSNKEAFAPNAKILRVDIDTDEVTNSVHSGEKIVICDIKKLLPVLAKMAKNYVMEHSLWQKECKAFKNLLVTTDGEPENAVVRKLSEMLQNYFLFTTDVGQNQVWIAQSFMVMNKQRILFSGGHGAMGYSLPAAIGAYYATKKPVICFVGDGGMQMNIQELQFVVREKLPIKIILLNNSSLGMIRHFQEMYFKANYTQTVSDHGYTVPDFRAIAQAYGMKAETVDFADIDKIRFIDGIPEFFNVCCRKKTYVFPKLAINKPIHDQEPLLERDVFAKLDTEDFT